MVPVYLKTPDGLAPDEGLYYIVAGNGVFCVRRTPLFTAATRAEEVGGLEPHRERVTLHFPKIPRSIVETIIGFFTHVYRRWHGEAIAFLFYSPEQRAFRVDVPRQTLPRYRSGGRWRTEGRLEYGVLPRPDGFLKLGDVHSHGESPAFFSGTDDRDDEEDGLRVVIGRLDRPKLDVCASFVVGGRRFPLAADAVLEIPPVPFAIVHPPEEWIQRVVCRYESTQTDDGWRIGGR